MSREKSKQLIERARQVIPGGVNSPVRAFGGVGGDPVFFAEGHGAVLTDVDGNSYVDYVGSWGPMLFGHTNDTVVSAVVAQANRSLGYGAPTEGEIDIAERIIELVPSVDAVRMVNSGTEATMTAIRLARGFTGRDLVIKFAGCYHGHSDGLLSKAGSGLLTLGLPNSPGIPADIAKLTLTLPFNDADAVAAAFKEYPGQIAAVILEPIAGNMGCIPPSPGYLEALRQLTSDAGALLIFDEVISGFRVAAGGAQALYGVTPDLTTLGKIIGGGLPVGAFGGRGDIMDHVAPNGGVYQAGTLSGNPLAVAAGLAMLNALDDSVYAVLEQRSGQLAQGILQAAEQTGHVVTVNEVCGMVGLFFDVAEVTNYDDVVGANAEKYAKFFHGMLQRGVYLAPSAFEVAFLSTAHTEEQISHTVDAATEVLRTL